MAVAQMLKVTVFGHRPIMDETVGVLQRVGVLEIEAEPFDLPAVDVPADDERLRRTDEHLADARFVLDFLGRSHKNEQPFSTFVSEKFHIDEDDYHALTFDERFKALYDECVRIADGLAHGERERARLTALAHDLEPWADFRLQIPKWHDTGHVALFTGTVPASAGASIRQTLREAVAEVTVEELGAIGDRQAWVVMAHRSCVAAVRNVLATTGFAEVTFPGLADYPAEELSRAQGRISEFTDEAERLSARAAELSEEHYEHAVMLVQALESQRDSVTVRREFGETERTFAISGWVRASDAQDLEATLAMLGDHVDLTLAQPADDEEPPVELNNPRWLQPLEVLTDLYGRPRYRETDPTILLAPFFLAFFGICIGDVGYGLMLVVGSWLIKTRLDVAPGVKRFLTLMQYGGAVAMVFGVAFGSYLALPVTSLPQFLQDLQVIDTLAQLTDFLIFTLILGVVQVFFGVIVAAADAFRRHDPAEAVFGQLSTIFFFGTLGALVLTGNGLFLSVGLVLTMLMQGRALEAAVGNAERPTWDRAIGVLWLLVVLVTAVLMGTGSVGIGLAILGGVSVVGAVVSRTARSAVIGLLGGAYSVYGMSAFVGDILSYTRLAALGLSGALVGYVFNLLAGLVWKPAMSLISAGGAGIIGGVLVAVLAAAVFVVGHVFNVVINLLGAFVHPARLQFVEFFSKFYEGGGRPLTPFRFRADNLVFEAGVAGTEGGTGT